MNDERYSKLEEFFEKNPEIILKVFAEKLNITSQQLWRIRKNKVRSVKYDVAILIQKLTNNYVMPSDLPNRYSNNSSKL